MADTPEDIETTAHLLGRVKRGDKGASDRFVRRYLPLLNRWAHGLLPQNVRDIYDTNDLAQVTLIKAMEQLDNFEPQRKGAFLSYLRTTLMNQVRDIARKKKRRPGRDELSDEIPIDEPSSLERLERGDLMRLYEASLARLSEEEYNAVVLRIEHEYTYEQLAEALKKPSWNAARMTFTRAVMKLSRRMKDFDRPA